MFHGNEEKSAEVEKHVIGSEAAAKKRTMFHENEKKISGSGKTRNWIGSSCEETDNVPQK